jgi:hypothetical protein
MRLRALNGVWLHVLPWLVVVAVCGGAFACGSDGTRPTAAPGGKYDLLTVDGQGLPHAYYGAFGTVTYLRRAVIEFHSRGRLLDIRDQQTINTITGDTQPLLTDTVAYAYRLAGTRLLVFHVAFDTTAAYIDTAEVGGDSVLAVRTRLKPDVWEDFLYLRLP